MENQAEHEAEIHPQSSSSSSSPSPPSSPSSSSSSSSSPSHVQSFASSRSSQKELSAPSSSGSSSTSSSPFSGPSSPAHAAIDQALSPFPGPSSPAHAAIDQASSSAIVESETHESVDNADNFSSNNTTFPSSSAVGSSPDDVTLSELHGTQDVIDNNGSIEHTVLTVEPGSFVVDEASGSNVLHTASENDDDKGNYGCTPATELKTEDMRKKPAVQSIVAMGQCNGFMSATDGRGSATLVADVDANVGNFENDISHVPTADIGHTSVNNRQETTSMDESSLQQKHDFEIDNLRSRKDAEYSNHTISCHQEANDLVIHELPQYPEHVCTVEPKLPFDSFPTSTLELEITHGPPDLPEAIDSPPASAVMPAETSLKNIMGEEDQRSSPLATEKSTRSFKDVSSDINGLQRAKTMPSGYFESIDGEVQPSRHPTFKRSSTDKFKTDKDDPVRTPGPKISKKKQKRLMKRMCTLKKDGTVELDTEGSARFAPNLFEPDEGEDYSSSAGDEDDTKVSRPLQIAMLIVGTRGDVQPFVAIGKRLQEDGHQVRLATHLNFKDFVLRAGLEFYPLGGDPKILAGYMVKNKGFLPSGPSEIKTQKKQLKTIINSLLPACTHSDGDGVPFRAQAIIANPPAYGHADVAEALQVPLHIFFTMPWTPTSEFPHPLSRVGHHAANRLSYQVVDSLIWWGIRGIINDFRKKKLKLRPLTYLSNSQKSVSKMPIGYIWSPHLVPKPKDWGAKIDVVGFCFLNLSQDYNPPDQLVKWLAAGPSPIYVGFGSLPVEDPSGMTKIILEALKETSQRGIIDRGWGGIGTMVDLPDSVYLLDNCPHDWLFAQCAAVVHHGGAGTTAAGLKAACPTTIVPFFGDQAFWGDRVHARGVGPAPIPVNQFSYDKLVHAIRFMMDAQVKQRAIELAEAMKEENGVEGAVKAFHKHLPSNMPPAPTTVPSKSRISSCMPHLFR